MKRILYTLAATVALCLSFSSCEKNAAGRNTLDLVDDGTVLTLANNEYSSFLNQNQIVQGTPDAERVNRVATSMVAAVKDFLAVKGQSEIIKDYNWEFHLVQNDEVNAWCMPGGKIVVYTGIMPLIASDTDLAVVLGHEISHALLKHGNERMSDQLIAQYGTVALSVLLSSQPAKAQELFSTAYGVGSTLTLLKFSRKQESEADEYGLYTMATGHYNPNAAIGFWKKMAALNQGGSDPVILRTHPSDQQRIDDINELIPKALQYYKP